MDAEQEYAQMDYRICGELSKCPLSTMLMILTMLMSDLIIVERNKALDEFAMSQDANGVI